MVHAKQNRCTTAGSRSLAICLGMLAAGQSCVPPAAIDRPTGACCACHPEAASSCTRAAPPPPTKKRAHWQPPVAACYSFLRRRDRETGVGRSRPRGRPTTKNQQHTRNSPPSVQKPPKLRAWAPILVRARPGRSATRATPLSPQGPRRGRMRRARARPRQWPARRACVWTRRAQSSQAPKICQRMPMQACVRVRVCGGRKVYTGYVLRLCVCGVLRTAYSALQAEKGPGGDAGRQAGARLGHQQPRCQRPDSPVRAASCSLPAAVPAARDPAHGSRHPGEGGREMAFR